MIDNLTNAALLASGVRLDQYFGAWAIEPATAGRLMELAKGMNWSAHQQAFLASNPQAASPTGNKRQQRVGALAMISLQGSLMKQVDSMTDGTSTVAARQAIRAAGGDPEVSCILLLIDSPGGTVSGTEDLAADILAARAKKPVFAFVEDCCCSAAYWLASQCDEIYASGRTARIGSIGAYTYLNDLSKMAEKEGIEVLVFSTGALKGMGVPGSKITDAQRADMQAYIDKVQAPFSAAVAAGRKLPAAKLDPKADGSLATGAVWLAEEAQSLGLIDGIATFEQVLTKLQAKASAASANSPRSLSEIDPMATDKNAAPTAASYAELKAACRGADGAFLAECQEKAMSVEQARDHWMETLQARAESRADDAKKVQAKLDEANAKLATPGADTLMETKGAGGGQADSDARGLWAAEVDKNLKAGMSRFDACAKADKALPGIRERMVADENGKRGK